MKSVDFEEAAVRLENLLDEVAAGEHFEITRLGKPVARLIPVLEDKPGIIGLLKGRVTIPDNFDDPLPDDLIDLFYRDRESFPA